MSGYLASLWNRECTGASCAYCNAIDEGDRSAWKRTPAIRHTTPRAAYPHACDDCGAKIPKGERYRREEGIAQDSGWKWIRCGDEAACAVRYEAESARLDALVAHLPARPGYDPNDPDGIPF